MCPGIFTYPALYWWVVGFSYDSVLCECHVRDGDILKRIKIKPEFEKPVTVQYAMKAQGREVKVKVKLYPFLNPGAVWKQASNTTPRPLYLQDSAPYPLHERLNRTIVIRGVTVGWGSWVLFPMESLKYFIGVIVQAAIWHWGRISL